jgi:hypothetical protein
MKRGIVFLVAALAVPGVALAKAPHPSPGKHTGQGTHASHSHAAPKVLYVLKGTLSAYGAYDSSSSTSGSITIDVTRANRHGHALKGQTLTFPVSATTRIVLRHGATSISDDDRGIVKVKAPKKIAAADLASTLQAVAARQVIDQQPPESG